MRLIIPTYMPTKSVSFVKMGPGYSEIFGDLPIIAVSPQRAPSNTWFLWVPSHSPSEIVAQSFHLFLHGQCHILPICYIAPSHLPPKFAPYCGVDLDPIKQSIIGPTSTSPQDDSWPFISLPITHTPNTIRSHRQFPPLNYLEFI